MFLKKLYSKNSNVSVGLEGLDWDPILRESNLRLERPFEEEELKTALDNCDGKRHRGPTVSPWKLSRRI